jgi:hypothetical protein
MDIGRSLTGSREPRVYSTLRVVSAAAGGLFASALAGPVRVGARHFDSGHGEAAGLGTAAAAHPLRALSGSDLEGVGELGQQIRITGYPDATAFDSI